MPTQKDFEDNNYAIPIDLYMLIFHNWNNVIEATCNLFYKNYKLCYKCRKLFPANNTYFNKNENTDDKLEYWCITCEENKKADEKKQKLVKLHQFHKKNKTIKYSIKEIILTNEKNKLKIQIDENNLLKEQIELLKKQVKILEDRLEIKINNDILLKEQHKYLLWFVQDFYDRNRYMPTIDEFKNTNCEIPIDVYLQTFDTWNRVIKLTCDLFYNKHKYCPKCRKLLPPNDLFFGKDNSTNDGLQCWCRTCKNKNRKDRHGKAKTTGEYKKYYEQNRLRHIASGLNKRGYPDITDVELKNILDNFKNENGESICPYCSREMKNEKDIHFDHFIPYSKKQKNLSLNNLIPVCKYCNRSKNSEDFKEWYKEQIFYDVDREEKLLKYTKDKILQTFYT